MSNSPNNQSLKWIYTIIFLSTVILVFRQVSNPKQINVKVNYHSIINPKTHSKSHPKFHHNPTNQVQNPKNFNKFQQNRKTHIKNTCEKNGYKYNSEKSIFNKNLLSHQLEVLTSKSLLFCVPPKTGTSNWKRLFVATFLNKTVEQVFISDNVKNEFNDKLYTTIPRWKSCYAGAGFHSRTRLEKYEFRLINVRHPLARLYSGWKDKFHNHPENVKYGRLLNKYFGKWDKYIKPFESSGYPKDGNARVSFKSFIKWIADPKSKALSSQTDNHWNSIFNICSPCYSDYNIISKIEEADISADKILRAVGIPESVGNFPKAYSTTEMKTNDDNFNLKLKKLYSENEISEDLICNIHKAYRMDFLLFEYDILPFLAETKTLGNCSVFTK